MAAFDKERAPGAPAPRAAPAPPSFVPRRTSSFNAAAGAAPSSMSMQASTADPGSALKELEFDGRMGAAGARRGGGGGGGGGGERGGERGGDGKAEFEDSIIHSIAGIVKGLAGGSDAQKSLILFEVQQLISHSHSVEYALKTLVPVICDNVAGWSQDLQICAAEALVGIQAAKLPHEQAAAIVDTAFRILRRNQDPNMFRAWGEILVAILSHVKWSAAELEQILANLDAQQGAAAASAAGTPPAAAGRAADALPPAARPRPADSHDSGPSPGPPPPAAAGADAATGAGAQHPAQPTGAGYSAPELAQKLTARIIGPIAVSATPDLVKNVLLTRALALTADPDVEVRGMVVESLAFIGAAVDIETVERRVWPSLLALVQDRNARLHAATLRTISRIAEAHRKTTPGARLFADLMPPVFVRECQYLRKQAQADQRLVDDDTYLLIEINAEIFGEMLFSCHRFLSDEASRKDVFRAFQAMATCNGPVVRRHCAFNIPGVALSLLKRCRSDIATIAEFLSRDADAETRWNLAAGLHETAKTLCCDDTLDSLFKSVNALLHDESPLVRMNMLVHLDDLLGTLTSHNPYKAMKKLEAVFQNLQLLSEGNWRTQELLAKQLRLVAPLVPPQCIRANVLPLLYQLTDESSYTVRKASMAAVAVCMRFLPDTTERDEVMETFRLEWGRGAVFWMRIGFIDSAETAVETYSRILFRDTFAAELLRLASDPVANVRIRAARLMHKIAPACHQMEEYQAALTTLEGDADVDVLEALENVEEKIQAALAAGKKSFERDMTREAEEQSLYTKHLQLKAEVHKKRAGVKHNTKALLGALTPRGGGGGGGGGGASGGEAPGAGGDTAAGKQKLPRGATLSGRSSFTTSRLPRGSTFSGAAPTGGGTSGTGGDDPPRLPRAASTTGRSGRKTQPILSPTAGSQEATVGGRRQTKSGMLVSTTSPTSPASPRSPISVRESQPVGLPALQRASSDEFGASKTRAARGSVKTLMVKMSPRGKHTNPFREH